MALQKKLQRKLSGKRIAAVMLLFLGNIVLFLIPWLQDKYDVIYVEHFLYQLKTSSAGVHRALTANGIVWVGGWSIALTGAEIGLYLLLSVKIKGFLQKIPVLLSSLYFLLCVGLFAVELGVAAYVGMLFAESDFIEEHCVEADKVQLTFPEQKRNLVYIYLESMENTFAKVPGQESVDYIPELTALAEEHINFSHTEELGGAYPCAGTIWTASAMVAHTAGIPVKVPLRADVYGKGESYMPGVFSLGEVLEEAGYNQVLLLGSDAEFHGREPYFKEHGNYTILDTKSLKESGRLDEDYRVWWGFEDEMLFDYAREELTRLAAQEEPFNFTMLTADSHFPDGYRCGLCEEEYPSQYANALACSARQVKAFVDWIMEQPFYENTTVILTGDHLTMDSSFLEGLTQEYERTIYNCFINAPVTPVKEKNRTFATYDMFPTTLAAMGVAVEGDRLGLGTNLFGERATLMEEYGRDFLEVELQKPSEYYNRTYLE